jgi:hypothetical protein
MAHSLAPATLKPGHVSWHLPADTGATISFGVAFGERGDEALLASRATAYVAPGSGNLTAGMEKAAADRTARFEAVFDPRDQRYSGSLPLLETEDPDISRVYFAGVVSILELERTTATLPFAREFTRSRPCACDLWVFSVCSHAICRCL